jgi:uncharacterized DUF497 family protein
VKGLRFTWDQAKAASNLAKHGVSFGEAIEVFQDPLALTVPDPDHGTADEVREITLGCTRRMRLLVVSHTDQDGTIRIISARRPTRAESRSYQEY